ncbi:DUF5693 family protein [Paenibacillus sp. NPDC058174]|uniref:DUF5693 family protein n=1 Tax=Paenibacillus sp. NPDC058174 TaxID=3346366 RepID=UPI0036D98C79
MLQRWQHWNRKARLWLWIITLIGVIAALPLGINRMTMESTSKQVEYVFDYRDLVEIAEIQARPKAFLEEQLKNMKYVGITTMSLYESSLRELQQAGRLTYYSSKDAALLQSQLEPVGQNFTYILFTGEREEAEIGPLLREAFDRAGAVYRPWSFGGRNGMVIERPVQDSVLKPISFDPITMDTLRDAGFHILARFTDRVLPYDEEEVDKQLAKLKSYGVTRILFDGDKVKGFTDQQESRSINSFASLLNKYGMGVATIENLKKPQQGINKLAFITNYNVVRLYSLSPDDAMGMTPEAIADRFLLAAKDRNIRMFFLNSSAQSSLEKSAVVNSLDNLYITMKGEEGVVQKLADAGFPSSIAEPFKVEHPSYAKPLKAVVAAGAVALIALLINTFLPGLLIPVFLLGLVGSAGLYVLKGPLMEQSLALGAGIAAPTLALVWVMNRIYSRTEGNQRYVGGPDWPLRFSGRQGTGADGVTTASHSNGLKWIFEGLTVGRRFGLAIVWFIVTALMSLMAVPFVFGLLNNITYSLVLEQFRGVSLLHLAPIGLTAIYVLLYTGEAPIRRLRKLLSTPITVLMVVAGVAIAAAGLYYLSRTGNAGTTLPFEKPFRAFLETTFGVRPRNKEFLLAHPLFLAGLFLALRYRAAWVLIIVASIGQLSMVDTFAHIHTPLYISIIRVFLGLGLGAIFGIILIGVWQLLEGAWRKWSPAWKNKISES